MTTPAGSGLSPKHVAPTPGTKETKKSHDHTNQTEQARLVGNNVIMRGKHSLKLRHLMQAHDGAIQKGRKGSKPERKLFWNLQIESNNRCQIQVTFSSPKVLAMALRRIFLNHAAAILFNPKWQRSVKNHAAQLDSRCVFQTESRKLPSINSINAAKPSRPDICCSKLPAKFSTPGCSTLNASYNLHKLWQT